MEGEIGSSVSRLGSLRPESLLGSEGFKAPRWRTRLAAAELAVQPFVSNNRSPSVESELNFKLYEQVLRQLLFDLALQDSQWQVRIVAIKSANTILSAMKDSLAASSFAENVMGVLATYLDPQPEVQEVASRCISQQLLPSSSHEVYTAVSTLCDRFVRAAVQPDNLQVQGAKSSSPSRRESSGLDSVPNGQVLLAGITAAACLQLLPPPGSIKVPPQRPETDVVPLLVVVVGAALEDAHKRNSRVLAKGLTKFMRFLGMGIYRRSLLWMLNPKSAFYLPGMNLLKMYSKAGLLDEDTVVILQAAKLAACLNAIAIALGPLDPDESALTYDKSSGNSGGKSDLGEEDLIVLQHIMEMIHVPSVLTTALKDETAETESRKFLEFAYPLLSISKFILENKVWVSKSEQSESELVEDLVLCCATFAGGDGENMGTVLWTTQVHRELAISLMICLHESLMTYQTSKLADGQTRISPSECISSVVSKYLPSLLPRLKHIIKGSSGTSGVGTSYADGSLDSSIVAAHQMDWCLRQLEHPHLGPQSSLIMPCVLTALDHFSPEVKRQAMSSLLHLAKNLSPTEFQWNKDVLLDAVTRSLIGYEELWPVAVKLAVTAVTCCEGNNPRSSWYRKIFSGMLEELERQRDDQARRVIWLQEITPQMEAMGLVLVAHFSKLLPLLCYWLHAPDDATCLLALARLCTLIMYTWPRVPAHLESLTVEVVKTYHKSSSRKLARDVQIAAVAVLQLLNRVNLSWFDRMEGIIRGRSKLVLNLLRQKVQIHTYNWCRHVKLVHVISLELRAIPTLFLEVKNSMNCYEHTQETKGEYETMGGRVKPTSKLEYCDVNIHESVTFHRFAVIFESPRSSVTSSGQFSFRQMANPMMIQSLQ